MCLAYWAPVAPFLEGFWGRRDHLGHLGEQGGPGFGFVAQGGAKDSPFLKYLLVLFRTRTLHGTTVVPKSKFFKHLGFRRIY